MNIADVTLFHNGAFHANNTIVTADDIGERGLALFCFTNKRDCCRHDIKANRLGEWYWPNRTTMGVATGSNMYRDRGNSVVSLNRKNNVTLPSGVYECEIPDEHDNITNLFVGIYPMDMGK